MATINERIIEAATQLQASGKKPTMEAIREVMGGGSFACVKKLAGITRPTASRYGRDA